ncbi:MAG: bacillithiol biosynthesis BshC, partial [Dehalococcoidia bacterium]|nr:bacillithiol biosynthesis BshC [Dehalococcoidia bacterium]
MTHTIDPRSLYSQSPFFLDYIDGKASACDSFQHSLASLPLLTQERRVLPSLQTRSELCDALLNYNHKLDASPKAIANIKQLQDTKALCVIGGQQAEFLGGPLFVIYKIVSIIQTAAWLSEHLSVPVTPIFWLASEDHDFAEINHTRWLDDSGTLRTVSFDWDGQGRALEQLPITDAIRHAFDEVNQKIPFSTAANAALFAPQVSDDYCTWHARMWSHLFAEYGLVIVEPRVLRPLANSFFTRALTDQREIQD